jgi:tetratricopeptide (TPR) repeat protein
VSPLPRVRRWIPLALVAATTLAYLPALSAPFVMDDVLGISSNPSIRRLVPPNSAFTPPPNLPVSGRPVVNVTLAINYAINAALGVDQRQNSNGTRKAIGYRLFNLLFHFCTAALLFGVLRRAIRERSVPDDWKPLADSIAGMVCALWLLHPIQSEVINYIVQRTEALASLFYVLTLYCSLRAWDAGDRARVRWYGAAVLACVLGVGSKEIAITAPLAVILYDRAFRLDSWGELRTVKNGRGRFYIALSVACVAAFALFSLGGRGDSAGFGHGMPWYEYLYTQCWAISHYLLLAVWPGALSVDYSQHVITGVRGIPGAIVLVAFGAAVLFAWRRLPRLGWFAFLGAWFFVLLAPSSSIVPIPGELVAERRIYLALASVLVLMVVGAEWSRRTFVPAMSQRQLWFGFSAIAVVLALTTAARSHTYSTTELLWRDAVQKVPDNPRAWDNLGMALYHEGPPHFAEAEAAFRQAMARDSTCHFGCAQLATVVAAQGRYAEAESLLVRALKSDSTNAPVERSLALVLMKMGRFDLAVPHLQNVASRFPTEQHLMILGIADLSVQRQRDAISVFATAAKMYPQNTEIGRIGSSLFSAARSSGALPHLKELAIDLTEKLQ